MNFSSIQIPDNDLEVKLEERIVYDLEGEIKLFGKRLFLKLWCEREYHDGEIITSLEIEGIWHGEDFSKSIELDIIHIINGL